MTQSELERVARETALELEKASHEFTSSLMGRGLKPLISAIIRYIKITNKRLTNLEGGADGK